MHYRQPWRPEWQQALAMDPRSVQSVEMDRVKVWRDEAKGTLQGGRPASALAEQ